MENIAILDEVFRAFDPELASLLGPDLTITGDIIIIGDGFGTDEAAFEIGMDNPGGVGGG